MFISALPVEYTAVLLERLKSSIIFAIKNNVLWGSNFYSHIDEVGAGLLIS